MKSSPKLRLTSVLMPAALLIGASSARAAEVEDAAETAAARSLAVDGIKLAQAGKCDEATSKLARAEELHHSPIVLGKLGECLVSLGKYVEGTEALRRMLREPLPDNATPTLSKAYEHASSVLESAKPKIASINIALETNGATQPMVRIDDKQVSASLLGADLPADPGQHVVTVTASGYFDATQRVAIEPGGRRTINLKLVKDPKQVAEVAKPPAQAPKRAAETERPEAVHQTKPAPVAEEGSHVPAYLSWLVGAAGVGVGVVYGLKTLKEKEKLVSACPNDVCDPAHAGALQDAKRDGNIATIGMGVGGLGIVLGTIFYATAGSGDEHPERATATVPGVHAHAWLGLGSVNISGTF